jgi:hypothetical protein
MARIPKVLQPHINTAFPEHVCLVATALPNGYAQVSPRGSTMVYDDEHLALWERGRGSTTESLRDGSKVTVFFRKPQLRADGVLPKGGIARFYGTASIHEAGPVYEEVWKRLVQPEKDRDPEKKGFAVLVTVERAALKARMEPAWERSAITFAFLVRAGVVASTVGTLARCSAPAKSGFPPKPQDNASPTFCRTVLQSRNR